MKHICQHLSRNICILLGNPVFLLNEQKDPLLISYWQEGSLDPTVFCLGMNVKLSAMQCSAVQSNTFLTHCVNC